MPSCVRRAPSIVGLGLLLVAVAPPPTSAAASRFDPATATPYFLDGVAAPAGRALRQEDWPAAAKQLRALLDRTPNGPFAKQATFLLAYAELKSGQSAAAAARFDGLMTRYPLLLDYHQLFAAKAYLASGNPAAALERAARLSDESAVAGEALFLRAEAERQLDDWRAARGDYGGYLERYPKSWRAPEVRYRLAQTLDRLGEVEEAGWQWRTLYLEAPDHAYGVEAAGHLGRSPFTGEELARRAMALFDAMRNAESEAAWERVLATPGIGDALACTASFHAAQSVFKARQRFRAAPLFERAAARCQKAKDEELLVKSLYQGGRSFGQKGLDDLPASRKAATLFERVWREHPQHSYADDARLREAELYDSLKEPERATELYAGLPAAFPDGDQKGEAYWRLAFRAWRKGDLGAARTQLTGALQAIPREEGWWEAGRTLYWLGRIADRSGSPNEAAAFYTRAAEEYPLSYYALQALNRLRERWPDKSAALLRSLSGKEVATEWRFSPRPIFESPPFLRGVELARLGLGSDAKRELALAGIEVPKTKKEVGAAPTPEQEELLWLAAVLYDRAGEFAMSHAIPRHFLTDYAKSWPKGEARRRWLLSYPRGYRELIEKHTAETGQPTMLEFAIVREESAFDPNMESFANAVGLTQLTQAPAKRFAEGLPSDGKALRDPAINIAIGARELGHLWGLYGNAALAIASYNAGEAAVNRWLKDPEHASAMLDELVESIPYDETRGYTKRVLASYFAYSWLYDKRDPLPTLKLPLPAPKRR